MAVPIGTALLMLLGVGPALPWGRATPEQVRRALLPPLAGGAVLAAIGLLLGVRNVWTVLTLFFGGYAAQVTLRELWLPVGQRLRKGESLVQAVVGVQRQGRRRVASYVVHAGAIVMIVAIAVSSTMSVSQETQLARGQSFQLGSYTLTFVGAETVKEQHRQAVVARVAVTRDGRPIATLLPRMNHYESQREPVGTPAVRSSLVEDLYLSIMNIDPEQQTVGLHALVNPMVAWVWLAMFIMAFGGVLALLPSRRAAPPSLP
jgi:cytochrome c-type biogenesis protein CcmF